LALEIYHLGDQVPCTLLPNTLGGVVVNL
jgi:hypothetical protein